MTSLNWTKVGAQAQSADDKHEDTKVKLVVTVGNAIGRVFDSNPSDPRLDAVQLILGTMSGDNKALLEKLGISVDTNDQTDPGEPKELPAPPRARYFELLNEDGTTQGTALPEDEAIRLGYHAVLVNGELTSFRKPSAAPDPTSAMPLQQTFEVRDKNGQVIQLATLEWAKDRKDLEPVIGDDGKIEYFQQKPARLLRRR